MNSSMNNCQNQGDGNRRNRYQRQTPGAWVFLILAMLASNPVIADGHEEASTDAADAYLRALEGGSLPPPGSETPTKQATTRTDTPPAAPKVNDQAPSRPKPPVLSGQATGSSSSMTDSQKKFVPSPLPSRPASPQQPASPASPATPSTPSAPSSPAVADARYTTMFCTAGTIDRFISVDYEDPDRPVPCRVRYHKPTEGKTEIPWRAANSVGYCEQKADGLVEQLRGYGWRCSPVAAGTP